MDKKTHREFPKFATLLIDGDTIAFVAAAAVQGMVDEGGSNFRSYANFDQGRVVVENLLTESARICGALDAERLVFISDKANWRKDVASDYKMNRVASSQERPILLDPLKDYLREFHGATSIEQLEADDVIGIELTARPYGSACSVGRDKDFKTIPGWHFRIQTNGPFEMTPVEADAFFYAQALAGDRVDNIAGAKGIGMTRAEQIVEAGMKVVPQRGLITRGPNKGKETTKWVNQPCDDMWEIIVSHYEKAGGTEQDALKNARLTNILRNHQFDLKTGKITLWNPSMIVNWNQAQ
jgi:5'-3' exonuclease